MTNASSEQFTTRLREYCGSSLRGVALHSDGESTIEYVREDFRTPGGDPSEELTRWVNPPSAMRPLPRAIVTVFSETTTVHLSIGDTDVVSIVLDATVTRNLNGFLDWCLSTIENAE